MLVSLVTLNLHYVALANSHRQHEIIDAPQQINSAKSLLECNQTTDETRLEAYRNLFPLLYITGEMAQAETVAVEASKRFPGRGFYALIGDARLALGDCDGAIEAYEENVRNVGVYSHGEFVLLGLALLQCGKRAAARDIATRVLSKGNLLLPGKLLESVEAIAHLTQGGNGCDPANGNYCVPKKKLTMARETAAYAHAIFAEDSYLTEKYEKGHTHSEIAMSLAPLWVQWPFYCARYQRVFGDSYTSNITVTEPHLRDWADMWIPEVKTLETANGKGALALQKIVKELRRYECSDEFIHMELENFYGKEAARKGVSELTYSPQNYQYGTFFFTGFLSLFEHEKIQPAVEATVRSGGEYLMLGANVGNEAFYGALHYGLKTRAVEIHCNLVDKARAVMEAYVPKQGYDIAFECQDAMKTDVSKARIVYLDNEIWDNFLTTKIYGKLGAELPDGALVIGWKADVHAAEHGWIDRGQVKVESSWSGDPEPVFVLEKVSIAAMEERKRLHRSAIVTCVTYLTEEWLPYLEQLLNSIYLPLITHF